MLPTTISSLPPSPYSDTGVKTTPRLNPFLPERASRDRAHLLVIVGHDIGGMIPLPVGTTVLGRGHTADVRLRDESISRHHARIERTPQGVFLEDLESSNGTYANGLSIRRTRLQDGDKIRFGNTMVLRFGYHDDLDEEFHRSIQDALLRDPHTGAFNKKYFIDRVAAELAFARRHAQPLALLMIDVDFFKRVNDSFGHVAGDQVLVRLTRLAHSAIRVEDVLARYGGEELGILLKGTSLAGAGILAERLRLLISMSCFEFEERRVPVTVSIGVAAFPELAAASATDLIAAADGALYAAKHNGRNCVELHQVSRAPSPP